MSSASHEDPKKLPEPGTVTEAFVAFAEGSCTHHGHLIMAADWPARGA